MPSPKSLLLLLVLLAAPSLAHAAVIEADPAAAVRAVGETWRSHYAAGRYAAIPDLYTEDTLVMPRGRPAIVGRDAMRKAIGGLAAGRKVDIAIQERELVVAGKYAWYVGDFTVTYTSTDARVAPKTEYGRSLIVYRRDEDGAWRIHRDIDAPRPQDASAPTAAPVAPAAAPAATSVGSVGPKLWDPGERKEPTECDRLASSAYDRTRLAPPRARKEIDVPAAIAQCELDLARFPGDARIHFILGRLYGYAGDAATTLMHREAAAAAGNHNAIFLLGYLAWATAKDDPARCAAADRMRLGADRGNYSAQLTYPAYFIEGRLAPCANTPPKARMLEYVQAARPAVEGFFETLLAEHLLRELR